MMLFQNTSYCGTSYCDDLAWEDTSRWFREIEILLPNDSMRWKSLIRWFSGVEIFLSDDSVREHHPVASVGRKTHPLEPRHARHQFLLQHCHLCLSGCFIFNYNVYIHCDISFSVSFIYMFDSNHLKETWERTFQFLFLFWISPFIIDWHIWQDFKFRRALWEHIMCLASQVREDARRLRLVFTCFHMTPFR